MKLTDEELEFLDKFINEANINEEVFEVFTDKLLDSVICDANEVDFEEFTNNLSVFAIHCKEYEQEWIANHVTELFTDKFFCLHSKKVCRSKRASKIFYYDTV